MDYTQLKQLGITHPTSAPIFNSVKVATPTCFVARSAKARLNKNLSQRMFTFNYVQT